MSEPPHLVVVLVRAFSLGMQALRNMLVKLRRGILLALLKLTITGLWALPTIRPMISRRIKQGPLFLSNPVWASPLLLRRAFSGQVCVCTDGCAHVHLHTGKITRTHAHTDRQTETNTHANKSKGTTPVPKINRHGRRESCNRHSKLN